MKSNTYTDEARFTVQVGQDEYRQPCPPAQPFPNPDRGHARAACRFQGILAERDRETPGRARPDLRKKLLRLVQGSEDQGPPYASEATTGDRGRLRNRRLCPAVMSRPSQSRL